MKRITAVAVLVLIAGEALAGIQYSLPSRRAMSPLFDNAQLSCSLTPLLVPVAAGAPRMVHRRITQSASVVREDSVSAGAGTDAVFPVVIVPSNGVCTERIWSSDAGGAGCDTTFSVTPAATAYPPARVTVR
jgi:hypothetical protein